MDRRFIYSKTKNAFTTKLEASEISDNSIAFIGDSNEIWTRGTYYKAIPKGGSIGQLIKYNEDGEIEWGTLKEVLKETLCYGVQFDSEIADPHLTRIGNLEYHRTLPIQSQLAGCIAQAGKIMYWLHPDDWRWKKEPTIQNDIVVLQGSDIMVRSEMFGTLQYEKQWIKIADIPCQIDSIITANKLAIIVPNDDIKAYITKTGSQQIEYGAVLNGYDGTVRVYCPQFYIKSETVGTVSKVWITTEYIDDTWECQPEVLIDAYRCTLLNTVPENMGYLSTLPVNSAISVVNTNTYCRGGGLKDASYDQYLETDPIRTSLGKPIMEYSRKSFRPYAINANSYLLSYLEYKNIFYWLWVIEYANFNSQEAYNENLTEEGYHQGGLGSGLLHITYWQQYNNCAPITPCGYGNDLGNGTGVKDITIPSFLYTDGVTTISKQSRQMPRWRGFDNPFGDIGIMLDGIIIIPGSTVDYIYIYNDVNKYTDIINDNYSEVIQALHHTGYVKTFNLINVAHIIPKQFQEDNQGGATQYVCSHYLSGLNNGLTHIFITGYYGGLCDILASEGANTNWKVAGFITVSILDDMATEIN